MFTLKLINLGSIPINIEVTSTKIGETVKRGRFSKDPTILLRHCFCQCFQVERNCPTTGYRQATGSSSGGSRKAFVGHFFCTPRQLVMILPSFSRHHSRWQHVHTFTDYDIAETVVVVVVRINCHKTLNERRGRPGQKIWSEQGT